MNKEYVNKCDEIFERRNELVGIEKQEAIFQKYFQYNISEEYKYILENFSEVYIRDDYGFVSKEKSLFTDDEGYDTFSYFFSLQGEDSIFNKFEMYKQQLPNDSIPIADVDGGNLLCLNRISGYIYLWIHDESGNNFHLVSDSMYDFILSIRKHLHQVNDNLGIVKADFSADFLNNLKNYKE